MARFTQILSEVTQADTATAGGKGAALGELLRAGIPVPSGFVVTSAAFECFLEEAGLAAEIDATLRAVRRGDLRAIEAAAAHIQARIVGATIPVWIAKEIRARFRSLAARSVAVRSSATVEDSATAAWAGQLTSYLGTRQRALLHNIQRCWASLYTARAIAYRFEQDPGAAAISVAVVVQKMVASECSGVAFSVHPVTEDPNQVLVEAVAGLGEAMVSGRVTPDSYVVGKRPRCILDTRAVAQNRGLFASARSGGTWRALPEAARGRALLPPSRLLELVELVLRIENHYGFACDIEWAFARRRFYILQSRPITTLAGRGARRAVPAGAPDFRRYLGERRMDVQSARASVFVADVVANAYIRSEQVHGFPLERVFYYSRGDNLSQIISHDDVLGAARQVWHAASRDRRGLARTLREHAEVAAQIDRLWDSYHAGRRGTRRDLCAFYEAFIPCCMRWWMYAVIGEDKGQMITEATVPLLADRCGRAPAAAGEAFAVLAHPAEHSMFTRERRDFYALCLMVLGDARLRTAVERGDAAACGGQRLFRQRVEAYRSRYFYKHTDFYDRRELTVPVVLGDIAGEIASRTAQDLRGEMDRLSSALREMRRRRGALLASLALTPREQLQVRFARAVVSWMDRRKLGMMKQFYYLADLLHDVAALRGLAFDDVTLLTAAEVSRLLHGAAPPELAALRERRRGLMLVYETGHATRMFFGRSAAAMFKAAHGGTRAQVLQGAVASRGTAKRKLTGTVRIVTNRTRDAFENGEILVTSMTRVEFVPLMWRAKAIITDEGGVACHAAIVSREIGIPCVVGVKSATKVLRNGDTVEVDVERGVIRLVSRAAGARGQAARRAAQARPGLGKQTTFDRRKP